MTAIHKKQLAIFLMIALAIIYLQVIIGGITRLTGSGLSMTNWQIVTGTIPPLSETAWQQEFEAYQQTPQYEQLNKGMNLSQFKSIFFWEWLHRVWGRWGFMFVLGILLYFVIKKKVNALHIKRLSIFLFLYILQGLLGWFMVKSGLIDKPWVSHYRLTAHLLFAIFLFAYVLWYIIDLLIPPQFKVKGVGKLKTFSSVLIGLTLVQIMFGGFMSGLRAAPHYPSFPDMNGQWIPETIFHMKPVLLNFTENIATVQFTHRTLAYILTILIFIFWWKLRKIPTTNKFLTFILTTVPIVVVIQLLLGITTLLLSKYGIPISIASAHQAVALLLLGKLLLLGFQLEK